MFKQNSLIFILDGISVFDLPRPGILGGDVFIDSVKRNIEISCLKFFQGITKFIVKIKVSSLIVFPLNKKEINVLIY